MSGALAPYQPTIHCGRLSDLVPFKGDLYPIPNGKGICNVNNNGGKWLKFTDSTDVIDQIGDETRTIKEDNCITRDLNGYGGCVLDTALNYTLWAYGFWVGSDSTFKYTDGVNTYTYQNGVLISTVSGSSPLSLTQLSFATGENYYHIIFDLTGKTAEEINTYMTVNSCLFHVDNMAEDANFLYHRWLLDEGINSDSPTAIDSGSVLDADKVNGILFYDDTSKSDASIRNTTLYPEHILNRLNKDGYSKAAYFNGVDSKIAIDEITIDLTQPFNIKFITLFWQESIILANSQTGKSNIANWGDNFAITNFDGSAVLRFYSISLLGTISNVEIDSDGTNITVTSNKISQTKTNTLTGTLVINSIGYRQGGSSTMKGWVANVNINNEYVDTLNSSTIGTPTNVDFNKINIPQNAANKGYDVFGRKLLNKGRVKFNASKDLATGDINFDPQTWDSYYSFKDNSVADASLNDNTKWAGSNWTVSGGQAVHSGTSLESLTSTTANPATIGVSYRITFDATGISTVDYGGNSYANGEIHTASSTDDLAIWSNGDGDTISLVKIQEATQITDANYALIGFLPHLIDNLGCYVNNNLGLPFILPEALYTLGYIDFTDLYKWSPLAFQYAIDHPEEWGVNYRGYVYNQFKNGTLANRVCYANKRTQAENDKIVSKKYLPNYTL